MKLPPLENPSRYAGLYVADFGASVAVGYTAEEVALLLESERYATAKVYRIHNARPDGTLELTAVPRERFLLEAGLFFYSRDLDAARRDFEYLSDLAGRDRLPCRARLFLGVLDDTRLPGVVGLAYPAEYDQDVSRWMLEHQIAIGAHADGGIRRLETIRRAATVIDSAQLQSGGRASRSREEVLASVEQAIQRVA